MRLLLLLSALLTALTGAIGSRASVARPVEASALAVVAGDTPIAPVTVRSAGGSPGVAYIRTAIVAVRPVAILDHAPLYADRLRI